MPFTLNGVVLPTPQEYENSPVKPYARGETQGGVRQYTHMPKMYRVISLKFTALTRTERNVLYTALAVAMENSVVLQDHADNFWNVIAPESQGADVGKEQGYSGLAGPVLYDMQLNLLGWPQV